MKTPVLARALVPLLVACAGSVPAAEAPSAETPSAETPSAVAPSAGAERVFVEGALARLDGSELARVRTLDMDRVITGNSPGVISTLGALADPGVPLVIDREGGAPASAGAPAPASNAAEDGVALTRFEVTPAITGDRAVRLDMKIDVSAEGSRHRFTKVELFAGSRLLVWDTDLKTPAGESIVMLVQPAVIESDQDLKAILERRSAPPANR